MTLTGLLIGIALGNQGGTSPFLAKPYLQLGVDHGRSTTKSLTVVWHTTQPAQGWAIRYRTESRSQREARILARDVNVRAMPRHRILSAALTGLRAGESVKYELEWKGRPVFASSTRAPKGADQRWTMAWIGDTGRGTPGQRLITHQMHLARPDAVLVPGDIVYPHGRMSEYGKFLFPIANADSAGPRIGAPSMRSTLWIAATGNHDTAYRSLDRYPDGLAFYAYWLQPLNGPAWTPRVRGNDTGLRAASGDRWGRGGNFSFQYGNAAFIVLDSNTYATWSRGPLREWLEAELRRARSSTWQIVVFHHACFHSSKKKEDEQYMRSLAPLFHANGVDVVVTGHVHNYQRSRPVAYRGTQMELDRRFDGRTQTQANGPIYITTGAGGAELYDQRLADQPSSWKPYTVAYEKGFSFSQVDVQGKTLRFRQIGTQGQTLDSFLLTTP